MNRKSWVIATLIILLLPLVSAQFIGLDIAQGGSNIVNFAVEFVKPVFEIVIGETQASGEFSVNEIFLAKSLLLILLIVVIQAATKKVPKLGDNKATVWIITLIVSILAIRYMGNSDVVNFVLLPYGTLGIALTTFIPFLIFFYFIHTTGMTGVGRKLGWGLFAVVFGALSFSKYQYLSPTGEKIFWAAIILVALAIIFDRGIHRYFATHELNVFFRKAKSKSASALQSEYLNILHVDTAQAKTRREDIEKQLKNIGADIP